MKESTLIIIKPDAVQNGHVTEIINLLGQYGFDLSIKKQKLSFNKSFELYLDHKDENFYENLVLFMSSDESYIIKATREDAVKYWRSKIPIIRDLYGTDGTKNAVHGSDSCKSAIRELKIFFDE